MPYVYCLNVLGCYSIYYVAQVHVVRMVYPQGRQVPWRIHLIHFTLWGMFIVSLTGFGILSIIRLTEFDFNYVSISHKICWLLLLKWLRIIYVHQYLIFTVIISLYKMQFQLNHAPMHKTCRNLKIHTFHYFYAIFYYSLTFWNNIPRNLPQSISECSAKRKQKWSRNLYNKLNNTPVMLD